MDDYSQLHNFYNNMEIKYDELHFFKNNNKLPINQVFLEWKGIEISKKDNILNKEKDDFVDSNYCKWNTEIIPALDKRWLPKCVLFSYEPYNFNTDIDGNMQFVELNLNYLSTLYHLQKCSYHQFWCTVIFHPELPQCLASFLQHAIPPYQVDWLDGKNLEIYRRVYFSFLHVYERLLAFHVSETEYMSAEFGIKQLVNRKLINLPIIVTLIFLYGNNKPFCNTLMHTYFSDVSQVEIHAAETKDILQHSNMVLKIIESYTNRNNDTQSANTTDIISAAISLSPRPAVFNLQWTYEAVSYLLNTMATMNALFQHYKPAIEVAFQMDLPYRLPHLYFNIYREFFTMLDGREDLTQNHLLAGHIYDEINLGRTEFIDCFHTFVSYCLDKTLEHMGNEKLQEVHVETCLKLLNIGLDEEYFICDYNAKYKIENLLEMFESCYDIDKTRTEFIINCIARLPRHLKLETIAACGGPTIEDVFRHFKPVNTINLLDRKDPQVSKTSKDNQLDKEEEKQDVETKIQYILDMLPHLGDGFVLKCLEYYKYQVDDVLNAILENNLPPHLASLPFDIIRIMPEPQPKKPLLAFRGKKPNHKDVMALLDDKSDLQKIRQFILNGAQYEPSEEEDAKVQHVLSEFPRLPYEYVFDCLQHYKFNTTDTINAIRNESLPPHLAPITFDEDSNDRKLKWVPAGRLKQRLRRRRNSPSYQLDGVEFGTRNVYDDEYDDRFDDNVKIDFDRLRITEEDNGAYKNIDSSHWVFKDVSSSSESEDDDKEQEHQNKNNRMNFCTDPALLRAKREAKFAGKSKSTARTSNKTVASSSNNESNKNKQTEINRAKKEVHKSSRANHSRKKGAQWKRNRGMLPS